MAKDEFPWDAVVAGLFGVGVGAVLGRASVSALVSPAGATKAVTSPVTRTVGVTTAPRLTGIGPGFYSNWLNYNGWSCARWSALTRAQQIQFLRGTFVYGDYSWTTRGSDAYNQNVASLITLPFGLLVKQPLLGTSASTNLFTGGVGVNVPSGWWVQTQSDTDLFHSGAPVQRGIVSGTIQSQLLQLLAAINADCQVTPNLSATTLAGLRT